MQLSLKLSTYSTFNESKNWFDVVVVNMFNKLPPKANSISNIFETSLRSCL